MNGFIGNALIFYFIFADGIQWNSDKKIVVFTCYFGDKNLKTCSGIYWNTSFFGGVEGLRPQLHQKQPGLKETTTYFKLLLQTITWNHHFFGPSFNWKPGSFFLSSVSLETDNKNDSFLWQFQFQSWIFG